MMSGYYNTKSRHLLTTNKRTLYQVQSQISRLREMVLFRYYWRETMILLFHFGYEAQLFFLFCFLFSFFTGKHG